MKPTRARIPVVCDLSNSPDTPAERMQTYHRLFADALVAREMTNTEIRFRFRNDAGIEDRVRTVARLEQDCCAFFTFNTYAVGDEILLDVSVIDDDVARAVLAEFYRLPETSGLEPTVLRDVFEGAGLKFAVDPSTITSPLRSTT